MATATIYPFDPTGRSSGNRINNEQDTITAQNFRDYHYYIPKFAPFFEEGLVVKLQYPNGQVQTLVAGIHFYLSNQFLDASRACAKPVYGSISFLDTDLAGILSVSYNTVGGIWNISRQEITRILAEELRNPRITAWEQITNLPQRFPVIDHEWDLVDMVGASKVVDAIENVRAAILQAAGNSSDNHVSDMNNPHQTTKAQVGLGLVENYPVATQEQAESGVHNQSYMTPLRVKQAIATLAGDAINGHAGRKDNPHQTTKAQVGLGSVENYGIASVNDALAGVVSTAYMTPVLVKAVTSVIERELADHMSNTVNPHNVTKDQVGLFNLQNYAIASAQEAREGTRADRYMTPQRTTQLVQEFVTVQLDGHATRKDNPHEVSKAQVGLSNVENYPVASTSEMNTGTATDRYVTPALVHNKVQTMTAGIMSSHVSDTNNPHSVTAAQTGAYSIAQMNTRLLQYLGVDDTAKDSQLWSGYTPEAHRNWLMDNMPGFSASKLEGRTFQQVVSEVTSGVSGNFLQVQSNQSNAVANATSLWIPIATQAQETNGSVVTTMDRQLFVVGGNRQNRAAGSDGVMVRVSTRPNPTLTARTADDFPSDSGDVVFGYTWDATAKIMKVYARIVNGSDNINVVDLSGQKQNSVALGSRVSDEPAGITYITTQASTLSRIAALESQITVD